MMEVEVRHRLGHQRILRVHKLELVARCLLERRAGFRTHTDPVDSIRCLDRAVGFDRHLKAGIVQRTDQRLIELKQWLASGAYHVRRTAAPPMARSEEHTSELQSRG